MTTSSGGGRSLYPSLPHDSPDSNRPRLQQSKPYDRPPDPSMGTHQEGASQSRLHIVPTHTGPQATTVGSVVTIIIAIVMFFVDIVSDVLLAITLHTQAVSEVDTTAARNTQIWFIMTVVIIIVPVVVINCFSFLWYYQNKQCLGDYCVLHKMSAPRKALVVVMHLLLMGTLIRYLDMLWYRSCLKGQQRRVPVGQAGQVVKRLTPKGEVYSILLMVVSRDTAMLDMLHSFLQDAPQLIFQIFLLYRRPTIITESDSDSMTATIQVVKIFLALFSMALSLVMYQDELRRSIAGKPANGVTGTLVSIIWRMTMLAARVITIASFGSLMYNTTPKTSGTGWLGYKGEEDPTQLLSYPAITSIIFAGHWLLMTVWVHTQKSNFCGRPGTGEPRPWAELLYSVVMGWVHIFCFINHRPSPARLRMFFYYTLNFLENTALIVIWFIKVTTVTDLWFRITVLAGVEGLFLVGICCVICYYVFLHPSQEEETTSTMRFNT